MSDSSLEVPNSSALQSTCNQLATDTISRQAAIEALRDAENHAFNSYYKGLIKAHKIIAGLVFVFKMQEDCSRRQKWRLELLSELRRIYDGQGRSAE